jgi:hypothetical protein
VEDYLRRAEITRRELGRFGLPLVSIVAEGWPSLLLARPVESPESSSAAPTAQRESKAETKPEKTTTLRQARNETRSVPKEKYPYDAERSDFATRRQEAMGSPRERTSYNELLKDTALGNGRLELGILLPPERTLGKNIENMESIELAHDIANLIHELNDAGRAIGRVGLKGAEKEIAKLQKDTVEFTIKLVLEPEIKVETKFLGPLLGYGAQKGVEQFFGPEIEKVNDVVTAFRHAVINGDLSELKAVRDGISRAGLTLALHIYTQHAVLFSGSKASR